MKRFLETFSKTQFGNILALIIVLGCFVLLYTMMIKEIPPQNKDVVNIAVGFIFGGALAGVIGYYYGGTKLTASSPSNVVS
jgi:lipoprotein signal peptidase